MKDIYLPVNRNGSVTRSVSDEISNTATERDIHSVLADHHIVSDLYHGVDHYGDLFVTSTDIIHSFSARWHFGHLYQECKVP